MTKRTDDLLLGIAKDFERAALPMSNEWLCENSVTLNETGHLCDLLSCIIKGFVLMPPAMRSAVIAASAIDESKDEAQRLLKTLFMSAVRKGIA